MDTMIPLVLRALLILGSFCTLVFILKRVRHAKMQIEDTIFWIFFSALLLFISIFPGLLYWASDLLGFISPINLVYLLIIFVLLMHQFSLTERVSQMDVKLRTLAQRVALNQEKLDSDRKPAEEPKAEPSQPQKKD